jgi:hypothetical protein
MRDQGIAGAPCASAPRLSVSGLGVCDVWRLELSTVQWPWLVDELEDLRGPLEEALQRAYAQQAVDDGETLVEEIAAREYELRLVRWMRAQLPAPGHDGPVVFTGPRSWSASSSEARCATSSTSWATSWIRGPKRG